MYQSSPIVIDNGHDTTKAGFAADELPSLVFNTNYLIGADKKVIVGDEEIDKYPENEVMTLMENGVIYDFENIVHNWRYAYNNVDNGSPVDPKEYPLMMTEQSWNTNKNKLKTCEIVFEEMEVPLFSLVKKPLCQLYHMGRSNGLVIDVGSATTTITPVLDGIIQNKATFYSKYGGDFADINIMEYLKTKMPVEQMLPPEMANASESFKNYQLSKKLIKDFKLTQLNVSDSPPDQILYQFNPKHYQLFNKKYITLESEQNQILESLFQPNKNYLGQSIALPPPNFEKPTTNGLSLFILSTLKSLENTILSSEQNNYNKFNEILRDLYSNILITGNSSALNGLQQRIINDLYKLTNQYFPNYIFTQPNRLILSTLNNYQLNDLNEVWDKKFNTWLGASNLSLMLNEDSSIAMNNWFMTKQEYEELGEDLVVEKFK